MFKKYFLRFLFRGCVFLTVLYFYLFKNAWFFELMMTPFTGRISPMTLLWLLFMYIMVIHLLPNWKITMAGRKSRAINFVPVENYDKGELLEFVKKQNITAWTVMLIWLSFNAVWGLLYLYSVIGKGDLIMLMVFYYLSDSICMMFFCPFQVGIIKNRCCVNCRIFDWGHFMMFTPMLFIMSFWSWSLFFMSVLVLIRWELVYARYPERFWHGSNATLRCVNCRDKLCQIKKIYIKSADKP